MADRGVSGFAITDHVDFTNISWILNKLRKLQDLRDDYEIKVLLGVEITHIPPSLIDRAVELALSEGAEIVVVHGETLVEPVKEGTNLAAIESNAHILAHPGILDPELADKAKSSGIYLEISARKGHCLGNGSVAKYSEIAVINTDTHSPSDIISPDFALKICLAAGASCKVIENNRKLFRKLWNRR